MGIYYCSNCEYQMCGESFWCEGCGDDGNGNTLCDDCANQGCCDQCDKSLCCFCVEGSADLFSSCCGLQLCGAPDGADGTGSSKHVTKTLDCGHKGCNFREDEGCLTCAKTKSAEAEKKIANEDVAAIESIMDKIKSSKVRSALYAIIDDPEGKKRKREDERIEKLEFSLKRARNACNACRCGHAIY